MNLTNNVDITTHLPSTTPRKHLALLFIGNPALARHITYWPCQHTYPPHPTLSLIAQYQS